MSDSDSENTSTEMTTEKQSVIEVPPPTGRDINAETKNGGMAGRKRRSVWFGNSFGPLGRYGKLKKTQFVMGARNLEVPYMIYIIAMIACG